MFDAVAPLAIVTRGRHVESVHSGAMVGLDASGQVAFSVGDAGLGILPRSGWKPIQALALVEAGLSVDPEWLALVCASHAGTPEHLETVIRLLAGAGLSAADLGNTAAYPLDPDCARDAIRSGAVPSALYMNCSGKHAGMLATCVVNRWPTSGYLDPDHPVQRQILEVSRRLVPETEWAGPDGCGAPAVTCSLIGLVRALRAVALGQSVATRAVRDAMIGNPVLSAGRGRTVTDFMTRVPGLVAKDGAEGVFVAALTDGRAMALKVADGSMRPVRPLLAAGLARLGVEEMLMADVASAEVTAGDQVVGHVQPVFWR